MLDGHMIFRKSTEVNAFPCFCGSLLVVTNFGKVVSTLEKTIFVNNVQELCKTKGVSINTAVTEAGVGKSFIDNIKRGNAPSVEKVQLLASYFGVTTSQLLGEVSVGSKMDSVSLDDMDLIRAYHAADERTKEIVQLTLKPFGLCDLKEEAM